MNKNKEDDMHMLIDLVPRMNLLHAQLRASFIRRQANIVLGSSYHQVERANIHIQLF